MVHPAVEARAAASVANGPCDPATPLQNSVVPFCWQVPPDARHFVDSLNVAVRPTQAQLPTFLVCRPDQAQAATVSAGPESAQAEIATLLPPVGVQAPIVKV